MGANNSTRKITLLNDEKAGVIKLSESLAHRLRGQIENDKDSYQPPLPVTAPYSLPPSPPPTPPPPPAVEPTPPSNNQTHSFYRMEDARVDQNGDQIPAWSVYAKEAHLLASRLREEKELELSLRDEEWRKKIRGREKEYTEMAKLSQEHLKSTVGEVEGLFMKVSCSPVCQEQQQGVIKCYQDHPAQSLRCSSEVESFARCVDLSRLQSFMKEKAS